MAPKRFVYVLRSGEAAPRYYVGLTGDVRQRLAWHNDGRCGHTAKYRPWRTHVVLNSRTRNTRQDFERYLKSGSGRAFAKHHFD